MNLRFVLLFSLVVLSFKSFAGGKIKYYFTQPVNNTVSTGENAVYLNDRMGDTIVAYINRAKYTLDIAVYNYTSTFPAISVAVNNAYNRGVQVRWIYDSSSSNTGIPLLVSGVRRMASPPDAGAYSIMHNKFMIIDANSSNADDAIVWTGSTNWNTQQFNTDYNNAIVIQDQPLAKAYRDHFNMMWGSTGLEPNRPAAKFGPDKTDLGNHNFYVDGKHIELYFSPSDGVNDKLIYTMNTASADMYFAISTFTYAADANMLVTKNNTGVYVAGISDGGNVSYSPHTILSAGLGSSQYKVHSGSPLYHHKTLIVDPSDVCSDPLVFTGSHNWTVSADTKNDENTLIIHDAVTANVYYQSLYADFQSLGGTLSAITGCPSAVSEEMKEQLMIFPNPSSGNFVIRGAALARSSVDISVCDIRGAVVQPTAVVKQGEQIQVTIATPGIYFLRCVAGEVVFVSRVVVNK